MSDKEHVAARAALDHGWTRENVVVHDVDPSLSPDCRLFEAFHREQPVHPSASYALLKDGTVLGEDDEGAMKAILVRCSPDASKAAGGWAEALARFHPDLGPGTVLHGGPESKGVIEKLQAMGRTFSHPVFVNESEEIRLHFFSMNFETSVLSEIRAVFSTDGSARVETKHL